LTVEAGAGSRGAAEAEVIRCGPLLLDISNSSVSGTYCDVTGSTIISMSVIVTRTLIARSRDMSLRH
jgi:hypothetical protein